MLVEGYPVFVFFVQFCNRVLCNVLGKSDGCKSLEIIGMCSVKLWTNFFQKCLRIVNVAVLDEVDERIDEYGPQKL